MGSFSIARQAIVFDDFYAALHRENRLKKYKREWKINLIQRNNVEWNDLFEKLKG
jgi:putative endonuclease